MEVLWMGWTGKDKKDPPGGLTLEAYVGSLVRESHAAHPWPFVISAVGGGGKTSLLIQLFDASIRPVSLLTSTTALIVPGAPGPMAPFLTQKQKENPDLTKLLPEPDGRSGLWLGYPLQEIPGKYQGIDRDLLDGWVRDRRRLSDSSSLILCEADGSKRKALKAHAPHEPVIPRTTDLTLIVFGLSALGQPLDESLVHRSGIFSEKAGLEQGQPVLFDHLLRLLKSGHFWKGIPLSSKVAVVFNQCDHLRPEDRTPERLEALAKELLAMDRVDALFFQGRAGSESRTFYGCRQEGRTFPVISALVLAAGLSSRMEGANKLLLKLGEETVISRTVRQLLDQPINDLVIVTGHDSEKIRENLKPLLTGIKPGQIRTALVTNDRYREGQGTSVACGVQELNPESRVCFFVPGDQPLISPRLIRHLLEVHEEGQIMVPVRQGHRSSPVLFDRLYYPELSLLTGDAGGRQILGRHQEAIMEIPDPDWQGGLDLDTPQDYLKARQQLGL